jgi:hypothetical protein
MSAAEAIVKYAARNHGRLCSTYSRANAAILLVVGALSAFPRSRRTCSSGHSLNRTQARMDCGAGRVEFGDYSSSVRRMLRAISAAAEHFRGDQRQIAGHRRPFASDAHSSEQRND